MKTTLTIILIILSLFCFSIYKMNEGYKWWEDAEVKTFSTILVAYECKKANHVWVKITELNMIYEIPNSGSHSTPDVGLGGRVHVTLKMKEGRISHQSDNLTTTWYGSTGVKVSNSGYRFDCLRGYEYLKTQNY